MKIDFKDPTNERGIASVRSQITEAGDLRNFDNFLAQKENFDFENADDMAAARACCGGDHCCTIVIQLPDLKMS